MTETLMDRRAVFMRISSESDLIGKASVKPDEDTIIRYNWRQAESMMDEIINHAEQNDGKASSRSTASFQSARSTPAPSSSSGAPTADISSANCTSPERTTSTVWTTVTATPPQRHCGRKPRPAG